MSLVYCVVRYVNITKVYIYSESVCRVGTILTRGSQEPVIAHLVFNLTSKVEIENGGVTH